MDTGEVVEHLLKAAQWTASRSSGPGGQHRDKASTRAELTLSDENLLGLEPRVAARLAEALGLDERPLRISVQDERSLSRNQEIAVERLTELVGACAGSAAATQKADAAKSIQTPGAPDRQNPPRRYQTAAPAARRLRLRTHPGKARRGLSGAQLDLRGLTTASAGRPSRESQGAPVRPGHARPAHAQPVGCQDPAQRKCGALLRDEPFDLFHSVSIMAVHVVGVGEAEHTARVTCFTPRVPWVV